MPEPHSGGKSRSSILFGLLNLLVMLGLGVVIIHYLALLSDQNDRILE